MEEPFLSCRDDFPILSSQVYGKPLIYLDNAATTQKPRQVVERISQGYYETNANIHRGVHYLSQRATELHESARERVRQFLHARSTEEILFTRGTTEAINLVAVSYGEAFCHPGDEIVITVLEHHSNLVPWQLLCERKQMTLKAVPLTERGDN
jgi:cysteine desulfurase/selenocysteine lyase